MRVYGSILETIGRTPLVRINRVVKNKKATLYVKLEGQNPGGSVKDRIALSMVEAAERDGTLTKDKIILEPTSGNTGIGLAIVALMKGYQLHVTMSAGMSEERRNMLLALGATLILTDPTKGTDGAIMKARELLKENPKKYWQPDQFNNPANPDIHYRTTAEEIWHDLDGKVDVFVAGLGTSGTVMGAGKRLHELNPKIRIVAVEPMLGHRIQGLKNMKEAIVPGIYHEDGWDEKVSVDDHTCHEYSRLLSREEGIFAGMSAGAAFYAAVQITEKLRSGNVVCIIPDRGEKYLSTPLFQLDNQTGHVIKAY
ncbi:MAG: PLP-dependent cysteine synthase family protein [Candidatus Abyssobacteria bacterium SURF_17]|uniref:cysteine synthase n=1 Tax=Candidatus Abyssobacteria bacterium SURF_17 TaxID=2093361 RepID=A0A419EUL9_9BACT|nr:MAG: PLP-dependent cysteine synthase family protein [Candidatus Abyssubacteria bacterium SURF_17]